MLAAVSPFVAVDGRHHQVTVTLIASYNGANNGFNFDGYWGGRLLLSVPLNWRVRVVCENRGPLRNSCAVVAGYRIAFRGAATAPLSAGGHATFSFVASRRGTYRLASIVPGHEEARMYDVLDVGKTPRVELTTR